MQPRINRNKAGISNVVATIILIAVAIALAVAVAVWVFGLAGSAAKTATLQVQAMSLTRVSSGNAANLTLIVSNPSQSGIGINGFTLGSLSCVFPTPIQIPAGTQGEQIIITLKITNGNFTGASQYYVITSGTSAAQYTNVVCNGYQAAQVGVQYSGYVTTVSGQTYPFTVTASS
ncbi:archaellin/type IV pilin N-terminal domain-containing protein [Vulcanisaeta thermophila]|uniref:archaellin/type IV pilin N-terminal domain-containing protein n=1 Tax=Vulcanisaeta thermophila TaxID=867917 RepID=UPI00085360AD|nr:archaellin/type IV pilin N-terminal domain-containing protein [Vulcanisaeta thermophila]